MKYIRVDRRTDRDMMAVKTMCIDMTSDNSAYDCATSILCNY